MECSKLSCGGLVSFSTHCSSIKSERSPRENILQSSFLSLFHSVIDIKFFESSSKCITLSNVIFLCFLPLLYIRVNGIVPISSAIALPTKNRGSSFPNPLLSWLCFSSFQSLFSRRFFYVTLPILIRSSNE